MLDRNQHFFQLARKGKRLTYAILAVFMAIVFVIAAQIIGTLLLAALFSLATGAPFTPGISANSFPDVPLVQGAVFAAILIVTFGLSIVAIGMWTRFLERRPLWTIGFQPGGILRKYLRGLAIGFVMCVVPLLIQAIFGFLLYEEGPPAQQGLAAFGGVVVVFLGWMVQGAAEEALTRGWLMQTIGARNRPWIGVLVSSLVLVLLHGLNPNISVLAFVNLFLFSLFAAAYTLCEDSLWGICAWHSIWNWALGNVFGLAVSGTTAAGGIVLNLRENGPDLITGGTFGPEGGLAVSAVLLAGIVVLVLSARGKRATATAAPAQPAS
jgi:hypothetical protein